MDTKNSTKQQSKPQKSQRVHRIHQRQQRQNNNVSRNTLIQSLKIAYLYMPVESAITKENYGSEYNTVKAEHNKVKNALLALNVNLDTLLDEVNNLGTQKPKSKKKKTQLADAA